MNAKQQRSKAKEVNLVLWGDGGDEATTVLFVTLFRTEGLPVKVVGLGGTQGRGRSGLVLVPDMTLGEALSLTEAARYILFPFDGNNLRRFVIDPRLQQFIDDAQAHGSTFIQSDQVTDDSQHPTLFSQNYSEQTLLYPQGQALYSFIQQLF
ncbi:MAG: hypothetical protein AAF702_08695 [Chloroflexota bacterium]